MYRGTNTASCRHRSGVAGGGAGATRRLVSRTAPCVAPAVPISTSAHSSTTPGRSDAPAPAHAAVSTASGGRPTSGTSTRRATAAADPPTVTPSAPRKPSRSARLARCACLRGSMCAAIYDTDRRRSLDHCLCALAPVPRVGGVAVRGWWWCARTGAGGQEAVGDGKGTVDIVVRDGEPCTKATDARQHILHKRGQAVRPAAPRRLLGEEERVGRRLGRQRQQTAAVRTLRRYARRYACIGREGRGGEGGHRDTHRVRHPPPPAHTRAAQWRRTDGPRPGASTTGRGVSIAATLK
jgi:hypothetical protein